VLSLLLIPYGDVLFIRLLGETPFSKSLCLVGLTVGVVLLDFTSQACLTPCEALLSDASKDTHQHEQIFTIYSQMVSSNDSTNMNDNPAINGRLRPNLLLHRSLALPMIGTTISPKNAPIPSIMLMFSSVYPAFNNIGGMYLKRHSST
jgi:hypothetical protein